MIMIDLEGTLSDSSARLGTLLTNEEKYKSRDRETWKKYYKDLLNDPDRKSTRLNSSHMSESRMPSSA